MRLNLDNVKLEVLFKIILRLNQLMVNIFASELLFERVFFG